MDRPRNSALQNRSDVGIGVLSANLCGVHFLHLTRLFGACAATKCTLDIDEKMRTIEAFSRQCHIPCY